MDQHKLTGLMFGSFNPVHTAHLIIASHFVQFTDIKEVWFVLSPLNPFKDKEQILDQEKRKHLLKLAIEDNPAFKLCETELHLPIPSYTINTLGKLAIDFPDRNFVLLMGEDNLDDFDKWKDYQDILEKVSIYVYPRGEKTSSPFLDHPKVRKIHAPRFEISSTMIRKAFAEGKDLRYVVPDKVFRQIKSGGYYV